jgi:hypothetical protein
MHSTTKYWESIVEEPRERMEEEWDAYNRTWEKVNQMMINLQFPMFGSPLEFHSIEEVSTCFQRSVDEYQKEVQKILTVEQGHIQKYVVGVIKTTN